MTTFDSLVTRLGIDKSGSEKGAFRILDYQDSLVEAAVTAGEINKVLQSLDQLLETELDGQARPSADAALQALEQHLERWALWGVTALAGLVLFIAIVVVGALLFYRWGLSRIDSSR
jgi:hypothetical protein